MPNQFTKKQGTATPKRNRRGRPAGSTSSHASAGNSGGTAVMERQATKQSTVLNIGEVFSLAPDGTATIYLGRSLGGTILRRLQIER